MSEFKRGDKVVHAGKHSYFEGTFLNYIDKMAWKDPDGGEHPANQLSCNVQQDGTGTIFVKALSQLEKG